MAMEGTASKLPNLDTKMSVASSEHRARQAVAAAAQAAQASPQSSQFSPCSPSSRRPHLEPLSPKTRLAPPIQQRRSRRCCERMLREAQDICEHARRFAEKYKVREVGLLALGLASLIFLLTALGGSEPQPFAAVIAALLGWLTIYTYMLQAECLRLTTTLQSLENRRGELRDQERVDLEMSHIYNAYELLRPGCSSQRAVHSVLTASLVNDYLRLQNALRIYAERFGPIAEVGMHWNLDKTLVASAQEGSSIRNEQCDPDLFEAASQVGELPNVHCHSPRDVSIESPGPPPNGPNANGPGASSERSGMAEAISKTIASIEDSMNLPSWLKQIRH